MDQGGAMAGWNVPGYNSTGTARATKDTACIPKCVIDLEETGKDGKIRKSHYEGSLTKPNLQAGDEHPATARNC